jgi:hypothetical protein
LYFHTRSYYLLSLWDNSYVHMNTLKHSHAHAEQNCYERYTYIMQSCIIKSFILLNSWKCLHTSV